VGVPETKYRAYPMVFRSRGLIARYALDRPPDASYFLNMNGVLERVEDAISSRYGSIIINRDPVGVGTANYPFPAAPVTLARLLTNSGSFRYAALANGSLYRRAGDPQGAYSSILSPATLSGQPFSTLVTTCFRSSQPWLFMYDRLSMRKDNGTGTPSRIGILPPVRPVTAQAYAPRAQLLEIFNDWQAGYLTSGGLSIIDGGTAFTVHGDSAADQLSGNYQRYIPLAVNFSIHSIGQVYGDNRVDIVLQALGPSVPAAFANVKVGDSISVQGTGVAAYNGTVTVTETGGPFYNAGTNLWTIALDFVIGLTGQPVVYVGGVTLPLGSSPYYDAIDGMIGTSRTYANLPVNGYRMKFQTNIRTGTFDISAQSIGDGSVASSDDFLFPSVTCSVASNSVGTIGKSLASGSPATIPDLSIYESADLFAIALAVDAPANIKEIRVMFDVSNSGYTSSYYYKTLIPVSYQGYLDNSQLSSSLAALSDTLLQNLLRGQAQATSPDTSLEQPSGDQVGTGLIPRSSPFQPNFAARQELPADGGGEGSDSSGLTPGILTTGKGSWSVVHLQKGDFLPVGNAGRPGLDWSNITGWQIQVTTNTGGGVSIAFNSLYIQGGGVTSSPAVPASGPSSFGGVGYDIRYRYYNANTGTPSNGSLMQRFTVNPINPGGISTLIVLRQAINVIGQYSLDPQVTHVQFFVRGGLFGTNWFYADQIPNIAGTGEFNYKYTLPDSALAQGDILKLDNDVPVTSTLAAPITTTLSVGGSPPTGTLDPLPVNTNTPTLLTVHVADASAVFVSNQIVFIGTPANLEEVSVVTGGTGTFTAWIQLLHSFNESVYSFAKPAQPLYLAALAYGQTWLAGDPANPHFLYYTSRGYPENCPPQNHIPVGSPADPIDFIVNTRGALFVSTLSTWYQIFPGNPPYAQPTGSKQGGVASFGWALGENEIFYQAADGIRTFRGTDSAYRSLIIEWLYRMNSLTPVTLVDLTKLSQVIVAYKDNTATIAYIGIDGLRHRLLYSANYQRWRNDDVPVTAMLLETDTNTLVYAKPLGTGWVVCYDSYTQDYDDGGWSGGALVHTPIAWKAQTPYGDQGAPNNPKQYNVLAIDANPNGQVISQVLLFDDNNGNVAPVIPSPSTFTGTKRDKFQFQINGGAGQQAYRVGLQLSAAVTAAPEIYQADLYAAVLTDARSSYDSYWLNLGAAESKLVKQAFFDYTTIVAGSVPVASVINVSLYADGDMATPFDVFTLPINLTRQSVPMRVRFKHPRLLRLFRIVMESAGPFQLWHPVQIESKVIGGPQGYGRTDLGDITP